MEFTAGAVAVAAIAVIIPVGIGALGRAPGPPRAATTVARMFTSRHYGYTEALPAGWQSDGQARRRWDGKGAPADRDSVLTSSKGRAASRHGRYAAPTKENLAAYTTTTIQAARRTSMPGGPANRPGHHDRRRTRPAAGHAMPARQRLPGRDRGHHPPWHRLRIRLPKPDGDGSHRPCRLPQIPGRHPASAVRAPPTGGHARRHCPVQPQPTRRGVAATSSRYADADARPGCHWAAQEAGHGLRGRAFRHSQVIRNST